MNPITAYLKRRHEQHAQSFERWRERERWGQAADFAQLAAGVCRTLGQKRAEGRWREIAANMRRKR